MEVKLPPTGKPVIGCNLTLVSIVIVAPIYQRLFNLGPSCSLGCSITSLIYLKAHAQTKA